MMRTVRTLYHINGLGQKLLLQVVSGKNNNVYDRKACLITQRDHFCDNDRIICTVNLLSDINDLFTQIS